MIAWKQQGAALVGPIQLADGTKGGIVLVGAADHPKGAVLVTQGADADSVGKIPLGQCLDRLSLMQAIDILCMQERAFGSHELAPPKLP
jgi:hypothetical protein